jgi:two-component system cell cycle response regulator DivK
VLIVDDHEDTREMYAWCMRASGWQVVSVENGVEAIATAVTFEPDAIVMDLCLPVLGGLEAIRRLKGDERTMHIPVVACTAVERTNAEAAALEAGCDQFVPKPCPPDELCALLEDLVVGRTE